MSGVALHVRDWVPSEGERGCAVLLLHGFPGSTFSFREFAPALAAAGHRVLAVDLPGYGYSERARFPGKATDALWMLLDREHPRARWCLLGHSMGARIAGQMAALRPARVQAAAYLDGSPLQPTRLKKRWLASSDGMRRFVAGVLERRYLKGGRFADMLEKAYGRAPAQAELEGHLQPLRQPGTAYALLQGYAAESAGIPAASRLSAIPSVVLWGARDRMTKPEVGAMLASALPNARHVVISDAGHCPMETHPIETLAAVLPVFAGTGEAVAATR